MKILPKIFFPGIILVSAILLIVVMKLSKPGPPSPPSSVGNPFDNTKYDYLINPHLSNELKNLTNEDAKKDLNQAAAFWIDSIAAIQNRSIADGGTLKDYLDSAASNGGNKPLTAVFIVYNLPGRDCVAGASNGELICREQTSQTDCNAAFAKYKKDYIGALVTLLGKYPHLNLVAIIEPDSLPNAATNIDNPNCKKAVPYYKKGIEYAIQQLSTLPNITMYLDAAHGGWIGFPKDLTKYSNIACEVLSNSGSLDKVRGFSTNVSNYQPLGVDDYGSVKISTDQPCTDLIVGQNNNEINYINSLYNEMNKSCKIKKDWKFITDTGRNGLPDVRNSSLNNCAEWCNIKGGLGLKPSSDTQNDKIDAYFWLKTPGESDGCTEDQCQNKGFDYMCGRNAPWQFSPAPDAGVFDKDIALTLWKQRGWPN